LPLNGLTAILLIATGLTFAIWICLALPVFVLLLPFLPYTIFQLGVLPFVLLVVVPNYILLPILKKCFGIKVDGIDGKFTLKIASAQLFCTVAGATRFVAFYDDSSTYQALLTELLSHPGPELREAGL
jgi:hypothetical protein